MKAARELKGKNIRLRPLEEADVDGLMGIIEQPSVSRWWGNETREELAKDLAAEDVEVWAIEHDGRMVGMIQSYEERDPSYRHAGIDIVLADAAQNQGLGREALRLVAKYLFAKGHHRLIIDPAADNQRAIAVYQKIGFKPVGVMRQYERDSGGQGWHDGLLMDMLKEDFIDGD